MLGIVLKEKRKKFSSTFKYFHFIDFSRNLFIPIWSNFVYFHLWLHRTVVLFCIRTVGLLRMYPFSSYYWKNLKNPGLKEAAECRDVFWKLYCVPVKQLSGQILSLPSFENSVSFIKTELLVFAIAHSIAKTKVFKPFYKGIVQCNHEMPHKALWGL